MATTAVTKMAKWMSIPKIGARTNDAPSYSAPMGGGRGAAAPMDSHSDFAEIGEEDGELPF